MIIFAADLHLCRFVWRARKDLYGDSFRALRALQDYALQAQKSEPTVVVLGGDIFDANRVEGSSLEHFTSFVDTLFDAGIQVLFIQGNHDLDPEQPIPGVQGAVRLNKTTLPFDGHVLYGLDWMPREDLQEALKCIPPTVEILVLHGKAEHMLDFEAAADFSVEDIPEHVKSVLVGDIHVNKVFEFSHGVCVSPGAMHPTKIDQVGPFGFYVLPRRETVWQRVNIPGREIVRLSLLEPEEIEKTNQILQLVASRSTPNLEPLVEIRYSSDVAEYIDGLGSRFPQVRFFLKASAKGKFLTQADLQEAQQSFKQLDLINSLPVMVDTAKEQELYDLLHGVLTGNALQIIEQRVEAVCGQ